MPPELVLASTSPYRRALLERLGIPFRVAAPRLDEEAFKARSGTLSPRELAASLARAKAETLAVHESDAAILGGDQLVAFEGRILGKPGTPERAVEQLLAMAGKSHELITAIAVWHGGHLHEHLDIATLTFRPLTRDEATRYVAADRPTDCAGSYKLESRGIALFESILCGDHSAITGIPLIALTTILRRLAFVVP